MGNAASHNQQHGHHYSHHRHSSMHPNVSKKSNETVEAFLKWFQENDKLTNENLLKYFSNSNIFRILLSEYDSNSSTQMSQSQQKQQQQVDIDYLRGFLDDAINAYSTATIAQCYIDHIFGDDNDGLDAKLELALLREIFFDCLICTLKYIDPATKPNSVSVNAKKTLNSLMSSFDEFNLIEQQNENEVTLFVKKISFKNWIFNEYPDLFYGYHYWLVQRVRDKAFLTIDETKEVQAKDLSDFMNTTMAWYFCFNLPVSYIRNLETEKNCPLEKLKNCLVNNRWKMLYSSDSNGLSLNRFTNNLFNYKAATILFVYCKNGACYCVCSNKEYREAPIPYGDPQTKIYKIWPKFKEYDLKDPSKSIYLNTRSRGLRLGLIFGDNEKQPIVHIDPDFHYVNHDSNSNDLLISIEVWGCGNEKELNHQSAMKKWENKQIEKMQTAKFDYGGDADKAILDLAGIKTDHSERGDI